MIEDQIGHEPVIFCYRLYVVPVAEPGFHTAIIDDGKAAVRAACKKWKDVNSGKGRFNMGF